VLFSNGETVTRHAIVNLEDSITNLHATVAGTVVTVTGEANPSDRVAYITWDWEDSYGTTGPFPQTHAYSSTYANMQRTIVVIAYYTDGSSVAYFVGVTLGSTFVLPEYWLAGLGGLAACIAALAVFMVAKPKKPSLF
jgi:hypothetical protein